MKKSIAITAAWTAFAISLICGFAPIFDNIIYHWFARALAVSCLLTALSAVMPRWRALCATLILIVNAALLYLGFSLMKSLILCSLIALFCAVLMFIDNRWDLRLKVVVPIISAITLAIQIVTVTQYWDSYVLFSSGAYPDLPNGASVMLNVLSNEIGMLILMIAQLLCLTAVSFYLHEEKDAEQEAVRNRKAEAAARQEATRISGWKCSCGRSNPSYTSTCTCGMQKRQILMNQNSKL